MKLRQRLESGVVEYAGGILILFAIVVTIIACVLLAIASFL